MQQMKDRLVENQELEKEALNAKFHHLEFNYIIRVFGGDV